jgi:hypothetical protein
VIAAVRLARLAQVALLAAAACHTGAPAPAARATPTAAPRLLDEAHAAALRRAFDEARDRPRYIVALSPT